MASKWRLTKRDEQEIQEEVDTHMLTLTGTAEENAADAEAFRHKLVQ